MSCVTAIHKHWGCSCFSWETRTLLMPHGHGPGTGLHCTGKPALTAHLHQLPAPASDPQISDFSAVEMELEVRDQVAEYQKKVTLDEVITSRRFLLAVKTPPHVGNLGSRVNHPFLPVAPTSTSAMSCHFSWAGRSMVTLLMKRS